MVLYQKNKQTKKFKFYLFSIIGHVEELVIGIQNASIVGRFQIVNGDPVFITLEIQEIILWHFENNSFNDIHVTVPEMQPWRIWVNVVSIHHELKVQLQQNHDHIL